MITASRSGISLANLQEVLDASAAPASQTVRKNLAQYLTPAWFAERMAALLPNRYACTVAFDPQCGADALLDSLVGYNVTTLGVDLDRRFNEDQGDGVRPVTAHRHRLTASCVDVWRLLDELYPTLTFRCQVANPPFGLKWKMPDILHGAEDSTLATYRQLIKRAGTEGVGYMIANRSTLERLNLPLAPHVWLYQTFPVGVFDAEVEVGVLHFAAEHTGGAHVVHHASAAPDDVRRVCDRITPPRYYAAGTPAAEVAAAFEVIRSVLAEEKRQQPPFNIYLDARGYLRTYLSTRNRVLRQLTVRDVEKLAQVDQCNPLTLTTERDTRLLMAELVQGGTYTVQPEAAAAIKSALADVATLSCPIMDATDFESVAYADDNEALLALAHTHGPGPSLTRGQRYPTTTGTYTFVNHYNRMRLHLAAGATYAAEHAMQLTGQDRFITIKDDAGIVHRFLDRPTKDKSTDHPDTELWRYFQKPTVETIATKYPAEVRKNLAVMDACEMLAGFTYYAGQKEYYSRVAVRDYALVGAATGTGKSLGAITLIALKAPQRALIVAPQGTTRGKSKDNDEDAVEDMQASQWISELRRFAPGLQVFELFGVEDYERIVACNHGELPHGVYVSYYEAMFSNGARESHHPGSKFTDRSIAKLLGVPDPAPDLPAGTTVWCEGIGHEKNGIRCIATPCLATRIGHLFDLVAYDEAHKCQKLSANVSQMMIRLQPRYRYALTATPIPNLVVDLFPLMGWLCVPGWYRGGIRNAAWPYSRGEGHRFSSTFLSVERDLTQEAMNKEEDHTWRGKCEKASPIISAPARLLKIIKPTMAFISKEACNPHKPKVTIHDVRVPLGAQQARLYQHYMNRANVPHENRMVRAALQVTILRDLCAAPAASDWNRIGSAPVRSNFNPKTAAILSLVRDILARREQAVIVCSRLNQSAYLQRRLAEAGVPVSRIDSSLPPERHTEQANLFKQGRTPVMLMGIKCAQAHSFDQCPNLIVGSLEYSFGAFEQACGRIDRVTSKLPMHIYCVLHKNSIEEIMFDVVATKGDAATICLRGQRVPRNFVAADLGDVLAKNFEQFQLDSSQPDEAATEAGWPALCAGIHTALTEHHCHMARNGS